MILQAIVLITVLILFLLGAIHVYWACGGQFGAKAVIPVSTAGPDSPHIFVPGKFAAIIVSFLLWGAAYALLVQSGLITDSLELDSRIPFYFCVVCCGVFALRTIGDFHYVGWFRTVRDTQFASKDKMFYTPLCLFLAIIFGLVSFGIIP